MPANKNDIRAMEALIAESEAHTEHLQRHLARMLHGQQSKQLRSDVQTPNDLMAWWNKWAKQLGKPTITVMSAPRVRGFHERLASGQLDVKKLEERLHTLNRFTLTNTFFTFDWLIRSEDNFTKFIEGQYSNDAIMNATAEARATKVEPTQKGTRSKLDDLLDGNI